MDSKKDDQKSSIFNLDFDDFNNFENKENAFDGNTISLKFFSQYQRQSEMTQQSYNYDKQYFNLEPIKPIYEK